MSTPFRKPSTGLYYLRKRIPEELQACFLSASGKPKKEYWESLSTRELSEAKKKFPAALARCEKMFEIAGKKLEDEEHLSFTEKDLKALAGTWLKKTLKEDGHQPDRDETELLWLSDPIV